MEPMRPEHAEPELDALLRNRRPEPDGAWVHATGERLFAPRRRASPALRLGAAFAGGLATLMVVLSLGGPPSDVDAKDQCRDVTVTRVQPVPRLITTKAGKSKVVYTRKPVTRTVRRCG